MPWISLGLVTPTAGTPKRITAGLTSPTARYACHAVLIEQIPTNTGYVYIGDSTLNSTTFVGCMAILAIPTANSLPSANAGIPDAPNAILANEIYIDTSVNGNGAIVSVLVN